MGLEIVPGGPEIQRFANKLIKHLPQNIATQVQAAYDEWQTEAEAAAQSEINSDPPVAPPEAPEDGAPVFIRRDKMTEEQHREAAHEWLYDHPEDLPEGGVYGTDHPAEQH